MPQIHIQKVLKDRCVVVTNNRHTIPVISDRGEFYVSATAASNALTNRSNAVGSALCHGYAAAGRHWRFATLDECVKNGVDPGKHRTPDGAVVARARDGKTEVTLHPVPYTEAGLPRKVPAKRTQEPEATFYAVTWPDGAVTVRANHGSTWTMTRKRADDVPEEMLREAIWISKRPAASA